MTRNRVADRGRGATSGVGGLVESAIAAGLTSAGRMATMLQRRVGSWIAPEVLHDPPARWRGHGPVVLVGGYGATDALMAPMVSWLDELGYDVVAFTVGSGLGCADQATNALADRLREVADQPARAANKAGEGARLRLVGHSRGGQFARVAAGRVRDEVDVAGLVTLGTPFDPLGVRWPVWAQIHATALAGSVGVPGLFTWGSLHGRCCARYRRRTRAPWPRDVPFTSIVGRRDAAVPPSSSVDPYADNVEIDVGHLGLLTSPSAFAATAEALSGHRPPRRATADAVVAGAARLG